MVHNISPSKRSKNSAVVIPFNAGPSSMDSSDLTMRQLQATDSLISPKNGSINVSKGSEIIVGKMVEERPSQEQQISPVKLQRKNIFSSSSISLSQIASEPPIMTIEPAIDIHPEPASKKEQSEVQGQVEQDGAEVEGDDNNLDNNNHEDSNIEEDYHQHPELPRGPSKIRVLIPPLAIGQSLPIESSVVSPSSLQSQTSLKKKFRSLILSPGRLSHLEQQNKHQQQEEEPQQHHESPVKKKRILPEKIRSLPIEPLKVLGAHEGYDGCLRNEFGRRKDDNDDDDVVYFSSPASFSWSFDVRQFTNSASQLAFVCQLADTFRLGQILNLSSSSKQIQPQQQANNGSLVEFFKEVQQGYEHHAELVVSRKYHTFLHAVDVLHTVSVFLRTFEANKYLEEMAQAALLIAALCHDIGHPGLSNQYLVNSGSYLTLKYPNPVLETMHLARTMQLIKKHGVFAGLVDEKQHLFLTKMIGKCIMYTDVASHSELLRRVKQIPRQSNGMLDISIPKSGLTNDTNAEYQVILGSFLLHTADISNPAKEWILAQHWTQLIMSEFFEQGMLEKQEGLVVSPFRDVDTINCASIQAKFVQLMLLPSLTFMEEILPKANEVTNTAHRNQKRWEAESEQAMTTDQSALIRWCARTPPPAPAPSFGSALFSKLKYNLKKTQLTFKGILKGGKHHRHHRRRSSLGLGRDPNGVTTTAMKAEGLDPRQVAAWEFWCFRLHELLGHGKDRWVLWLSCFFTMFALFGRDLSVVLSSNDTSMDIIVWRVLAWLTFGWLCVEYALFWMLRILSGGKSISGKGASTLGVSYFELTLDALALCGVGFETIVYFEQISLLGLGFPVTWVDNLMRVFKLLRIVRLYDKSKHFFRPNLALSSMSGSNTETSASTSGSTSSVHSPSSPTSSHESDKIVLTKLSSVGMLPALGSQLTKNISVKGSSASSLISSSFHTSNGSPSKRKVSTGSLGKRSEQFQGRSHWRWRWFWWLERGFKRFRSSAHPQHQDRHQTSFYGGGSKHGALFTLEEVKRIFSERLKKRNKEEENSDCLLPAGSNTSELTQAPSFLSLSHLEKMLCEAFNGLTLPPNAMRNLCAHIMAASASNSSSSSALSGLRFGFSSSKAVVNAAATVASLSSLHSSSSPSKALQKSHTSASVSPAIAAPASSAAVAAAAALAAGQARAGAKRASATSKFNFHRIPIQQFVKIMKTIEQVREETEKFMQHPATAALYHRDSVTTTTSSPPILFRQQSRDGVSSSSSSLNSNSSSSSSETVTPSVTAIPPRPIGSATGIAGAHGSTSRFGSRYVSSNSQFNCSNRRLPLGATPRQPSAVGQLGQQQQQLLQNPVPARQQQQVMLLGRMDQMNSFRKTANTSRSSKRSRRLVGSELDGSATRIGEKVADRTIKLVIVLVLSVLFFLLQRADGLMYGRDVTFQIMERRFALNHLTKHAELVTAASTDIEKQFLKQEIKLFMATFKPLHVKIPYISQSSLEEIAQDLQITYYTDKNVWINMKKSFSSAYLQVDEENFFDISATKKAQAGWQLFRICLVLGCVSMGAFFLTSDINRRIILPVERMVLLTQRLAFNPSDAVKINSDENESPTYEIKLLEKTLTKIAKLLQIGYGSAGSSIISKNMSGDSFNPIVPGKKIHAVFGFCDIRRFTDITECLQENVMIFTNAIGSIVHNAAYAFQGEANKNVGDAFLMVWKIAPASTEIPMINQKKPPKHLAPSCQFDFFDEEATKQMPSTMKNWAPTTADNALMAFIKTTIDINNSTQLAAYKDNPLLLTRFDYPFSVKMGFGLHVGWAIDGAIGSKHKIDASYLSSDVNMSTTLESATKVYGVPLLMSHSFYNLLSPRLQRFCRCLDCVLFDGNASPVALYTCDFVNTHLRRFRGVSDMAMLQLGLRDGFSTTFEKAVDSYLAGDWQAAKGHFEQVLNDLKPDDGPSSTLYDFIKQYDFQAPQDWKGYRALEE